MSSQSCELLSIGELLWNTGRFSSAYSWLKHPFSFTFLCNKTPQGLMNETKMIKYFSWFCRLPGLSCAALLLRIALAGSLVWLHSAEVWGWLGDLKSLLSCLQGLFSSMQPLHVNSLSFCKAWWSQDNEISYSVASFKSESRSCQASYRQGLELVHLRYASPGLRGCDIDSTFWWTEWQVHTGREGTRSVIFGDCLPRHLPANLLKNRNLKHSTYFWRLSILTLNKTA